MAQGDLYKLLRRVSMALAKDMDSKGKGSERFRLRVEKYPHDVYLNRDNIRDEILIQLNDFKLTEDLKVRGIKTAAGEEIKQGARTTFGSGSGRTREESALVIRGLANTDGLTKAQIDAVEREADLFLQGAKSVATSRPRGLNVAIISSSPKELVMRFTPTSSRTNVYDQINELIFKPAKDRLARNLTKVGFDINADRKKIFFNVGHVNAVSTIKAAKAISAVDRGLERIKSRYPDPLAQEAADFIRVSMASKFTQFGNPELTKEFLIKTASVRPESQATNLTDSDYEAALLRDVRNSIRDSLNALPNDWANQKGSDSVVEAIASEIFEQGKRSFKSSSIKVDAPPVKKSRSSSSTGDNKVGLKKPKLTPKTVPVGKLLESNPFKASQQSPISLQALVPLMNQSLPAIIRSKMGIAGRLHNRTGRFSESAEIVSIDEGLIGYTYQKDPYAVFEAQGSRDPRPLIEQSIRQLARAYMEDRFTFRRF